MARRLELLSIEIDPDKRIRVPLEYNRIYDRLKKDMSKSQKELERIKRHNQTLVSENQLDALTDLNKRMLIYTRQKIMGETRFLPQSWRLLIHKFLKIDLSC